MSVGTATVIQRSHNRWRKASVSFRWKLKRDGENWAHYCSAAQGIDQVHAEICCEQASGIATATVKMTVGMTLIDAVSHLRERKENDRR